VVEAAKGLRDFARANPALVIKGGVIDGQPMSPSEIARLAELESREVLLAMLAGAMKASMENAAATLAALPVQMARLAGALQAQRDADSAAGAGPAGTDQTPTETPNDETVADTAAADQDQTEE
jgi:large subunit ribosomal protein L10